MPFERTVQKVNVMRARNGQEIEWSTEIDNGGTVNFVERTLPTNTTTRIGGKLAPKGNRSRIPQRTGVEPGQRVLGLSN